MRDTRWNHQCAGTANTTFARLLMLDGAKGEDIIMFDTRGSLHADRKDIASGPANWRKWELYRNTVKPEWTKAMAPKSIVFACANPIPQIWPHTAKEAGAFIVATGRGDFPDQVYNSICFPGLL